MLDCNHMVTTVRPIWNESALAASEFRNGVLTKVTIYPFGGDMFSMKLPKKFAYLAGVILIAARAIAADVAAPTTGKSIAYDWNDLPVTTSDTGQFRVIRDAPTATLDQLELHVTTLNPRAASHPPHRHMHEELLIVDKGTIEALINGEWKKVGPGSVIFIASNVLHGFRNAGDTVAQYHVVSWRTDKTPKEE
jgi:XRE family transcriptional regulator, regulator of sulfur utilization